LELVQDGVSCDRAAIRHGIRRLQLTSKGLRLNGKPFALRGKMVHPTLSDSEAAKWRDVGFNTLLTTVDDSGIDLWSIADRVGFFMLGTTNDSARFLEHRNDLASHPSTFGWIFNRADFLAGPSEDQARSMFYGVNTSARSIPPNADFLVCHENELGWLDDTELPKIVVTTNIHAGSPSRTDIIGWVESPTV
jgi:hypothetical protein